MVVTAMGTLAPGDRILAAGTPWMAAEDAPYSQPDTPDGTVTFDGFQCIIAACWMVTAALREVGRDEKLIAAHQQDKEFTHAFPDQQDSAMQEVQYGVQCLHCDGVPASCNCFCTFVSRRMHSSSIDW